MKIKPFLFTLTLTASLLSCTKEKNTVDYVLFSGKVLNTEKSKISVFGNGNNFKKTIHINEDGSFSDTLKITSKGSYHFMIGRERSSMYLKQGDQLVLSIDAKKFDESIKYTGTAASVNNYLVEKYLRNERFITNAADHKNLYSKEATDFKKTISQQKQIILDLLKKYENIDPEFNASETKNNHYEYLSKLNKYKVTHGYFTKKRDYQTPQGFLDELKDFDIDIAEDFENSESFRKLSIDIFYSNSREKAAKDSVSFSKALMENLTQIKSKNIKNILIKNIAREVSVRNENPTELYEMIMAFSDDQEFKYKLTKTFEKIKRLVKGENSPTFTNYENYKGGTTSLDNLKGKFVYIDVWATWCGPCKKEIPHLKKIEKEFHNKNIEFVSISIDKKKQHDTWKKMVSDKELGGIQLFADHDWQSQFISDYAIKGIPRFILIDPTGKIVSASAPRPSNPKLLDIFKELNI